MSSIVASIDADAEAGAATSSAGGTETSVDGAAKQLGALSFVDWRKQLEQARRGTDCSLLVVEDDQ